MRAMLYQRDPTYRLAYKQDAQLYPNNYSWAAIGGPDEASVSARGTLEDLVLLTHLLRQPVEIFDNREQPTWWGYIHAVEIRFKTRTVNVALGGFSNKIAVTYTEMLPGQMSSNTKKTTAWASDATSIAMYGTKEKKISVADTSQEVAEVTRDVLLSALKYPVIAPNTGQSQGGSFSALLQCKGWFNTLTWRYYTQPAGSEGYQDGGDGTTIVGIDNATTAIAQKFQLASAIGWNVERAEVRSRKWGIPPNPMTFDICADDAGGNQPGTVLSTGTIAAASFQDSYQWMSCVMGTRYWLAPATNYWLKLSSSGGSSTNKYGLDLNEALGYPRGNLRVFTGSWGNRTPDADLLFTVAGVRETTLQMSDMIPAYTEFITGIEIITPSGVYSTPYRDGANNVQAYLRELLAAGNSSFLRYLCTITRERRLVVYPEPVANELVVDEDDNWWTVNNVILPKSACPVGKWYKMKDLPELLQQEGITDPGRYFIEHSEYVIDKDELRTDPRGTNTAYDTVTIT